MLTQQSEVTRAQRGDQTTDYQHREKDAEGYAEPCPAEKDAELHHRQNRKTEAIRNSRALMTERHSKLGKRPTSLVNFEYKISL